MSTQYETSKQSKPLLALLLTILIWSTSPIALVLCYQFLPQEATASLAVLVATVVLCLFFAIKDRSVLRDSWHLMVFKLDPIGDSKAKAYRNLFLLSGIGFVAYPWCYVQALLGAAQAMQSGSHAVPEPVVVNMVNYLWPCFAVLFGWMLLREPVTAQRIGGLIMALLGALLAVSSTTGLKGPILSHLYNRALTNPASYTNPNEWWFLIFAGAGALLWGLYTALLPRARFATRLGEEIHPASFFIALLLICVPIHSIYLVSQWRTLLAFGYNFSFFKAGFFFLYSAGSLGIAHALFAYVRRSDQISLAAMAASVYFVFAGGTLLLYVFAAPVITPPIAAGFALIITGAYLAKDNRISPVSGLIIFFVISYGLSAFFSPDPAMHDHLDANNEFYVKFLEALTAVFAIFSGFILSRAIGRHFRQQQRFQDIMRSVGKLCSSVDLSTTNSRKLTDIVQSLESLYVTYVRHAGPLFGQQQEIRENIERKLEELETDLVSSSGSSVRPALAKRLIYDIRERINYWVAVRLQAGTMYEWLVLVGLIATMALVGYRITLAEPSFRIARAAFDASLIVIIFAISDFDAGRPSKALEFLQASLWFLPCRYRPIPAELASGLRVNVTFELAVVVAVSIIGILSFSQIQ